MVGRDPAPGQGQQALHADWPRAASEPFQIVTALWLLDDFTPDNGATRLVPGSHRVPNPLPRRMAQPQSRHPDQKAVVAPAGSVLLFNGHLLHGGTRNQAGAGAGCSSARTWEEAGEETAQLGMTARPLRPGGREEVAAVERQDARVLGR